MSDVPAEEPTTTPDEEFSIDETRRMAAIEAAKSLTLNNLDDFLTAAARLESYLKDGTTEAPVENSVGTPPA
jgi:hypothetical protein